MFQRAQKLRMETLLCQKKIFLNLKKHFYLFPIYGDTNFCMKKEGYWVDMDMICMKPF